MHHGVFKHNSIALQVIIEFVLQMPNHHSVINAHAQENVFSKLGQLSAIALVQGGGGHHVMSSIMYQYVSGKNLKNISLESLNWGPSEADKFVAEVNEMKFC